jgi:hypothetical protein
MDDLSMVTRDGAFLARPKRDVCHDTHHIVKQNLQRKSAGNLDFHTLSCISRQKLVDEKFDDRRYTQTPQIRPAAHTGRIGKGRKSDGEPNIKPGRVETVRNAG